MTHDSPIAIDTVPTPNPDAVMLRVQETLVPRGTFEFSSLEAAHNAPLARSLLELAGVELVLVAPRFVTVRKEPEAEWPKIIPAAKQAMRSFLESGEMAVYDVNPKGNGAGKGELEQRIIELIDSEIRPAIAMDGGDVQFVEFDEGIVRLQMFGACGTCPSALTTLKMGIEALLTEEFPEVIEVQQV